MTVMDMSLLLSDTGALVGAPGGVASLDHPPGRRHGISQWARFRSVHTRRLPRTLLAATLCGVLATGLTGASALTSARTDGASGIGDPYWPLDGNGGIDVAAYRIDNRYGFGAKRVSGRTAVTFTATQDLDTFSLDFLLPVKKVSVDGAKARFTKSDGGHELRITPATALSSGTSHKAVVTYAGSPAKLGYAGERNWLADKHEVVAMNEPHMAPWWFPSNDHPLDKAVVDIRISVPTGREVVANGTLRGRKSRKGSTTWHWRADEPMAPYLAFFAAGDFTIAKGTKNGLPWLVAVSDRLAPAQHRSSMRLMKATPKVIAGLERDLGDYPFSVVGGLTTSLDPGFALENQTRPTYPAVGGGYTSLVVHELAHQWFGDDIAVQGWRDVWLNEGFASFMEWRWAETHGGTSAQDTLTSNYSLDPSSSFWKIPIADPGADRVFDSAIYSRGAMTLQALRNRVGDEVFWNIVSTWIAEQGGGNGSTEEFEEVAARVSGQDLTAFFTAWLRATERPAKTADNGLA